MRICLAACLIMMLPACSSTQRSVVITEASQISDYVGEIVTIRGVVSNTKIPRILGVDVASHDPDLCGTEAEATGVLERWMVTKEQIQEINFAHRGPGVFFRVRDFESHHVSQVQHPLQ